MKELVRQAIRQLGFDLHRFLPASSPDAMLLKVLETFRIDLVLDVGANTGQYGELLRRLGYRGSIVSFEPLAEAHRHLVAATQGDSRWIAAPRGALGDHEGEIEINIAGNSASSSVLDMLESHRSAAPESAYIGKDRVPIARLDMAAAPYVATATGLYLKIDTQGYEARVIAGGARTIAAAAAVQIEMSLTPLYAEQPDFNAMLALMAAQGMTLWALWPGFVDDASGRLLQIDAIFARS